MILNNKKPDLKFLKQYRGIEPLPSDWKSEALTVTPVLRNSNTIAKKFIVSKYKFL